MDPERGAHGRAPRALARLAAALAPAALALSAALAVGASSPGGGAGAPAEYLGQPQPGDEPVLFAPGIVSTDLGERDLAISPDGSEICWTVQGGASFGNWFSVILESRRERGRWSDPRPMPFSGRFRDLEPCFSPDGRRLYFASDRAASGDTAKKDFDVWFVERRDGGWGEPRNAGPNVNGPGDEFYPSVTRDGALWFTSERPGGKGAEDIWRAPAVGYAFGPAEDVGDSVDTAAGEYNACVTPDGGTIVFGRDGDLFVSFRGPGGAWSAGRRLEGALDSPNLDYCPSLSPDGRFFFFTSTRPPAVAPPRRPRGFAAVLAAIPDPGHRRLLETRLHPYADVYWVRADFLARLRGEALGR